MRLLAVSDIHSHISAVKKLKEVYSKQKIDLIVVCGDFTRYGPKESTEEILNELNFARILAVPGNLDTKGVIEALEEKNVSLHGKTVEVKGINFTGFGGSTGVMGEIKFSEEEIRKALRGLMEKGKKTVLVTHTPPFGTEIDKTNAGVHIGSKTVREVIEEFQPLLSLSGHCHEAAGKTVIGKTLCINTGALMYGTGIEAEINENQEIEWKRIQLK
jgi:hypothetical protein